MAYYKKRKMYRKRRPYGRRRKYRQSFKTRVRKAVGTELKYRQDDGTGNIVLALGKAPDLQITDDIQRGTTNQNRIGDFLKPIINQGTIQISGNPASGTDVYRIRVIWFQWKELTDVPNAPVINQLLENPLDPWSPFKVGGRGQFKILYSKKLNIINNTDNTQFSKILKYRFSMARCSECTYDSATPQKNHLYFIIIGDNDGNPAVYRITNMFRYTDT